MNKLCPDWTTGEPFVNITRPFANPIEHDSSNTWTSLLNWSLPINANDTILIIFITDPCRHINRDNRLLMRCSPHLLMVMDQSPTHPLVIYDYSPCSYITYLSLNWVMWVLCVVCWPKPTQFIAESLFMSLLLILYTLTIFPFCWKTEGGRGPTTTTRNYSKDINYDVTLELLLPQNEEWGRPSLQVVGLSVFLSEEKASTCFNFYIKMCSDKGEKVDGWMEHGTLALGHIHSYTPLRKYIIKIVLLQPNRNTQLTTTGTTQCLLQ